MAIRVALTVCVLGLVFGCRSASSSNNTQSSSSGTQPLAVSSARSVTALAASATATAAAECRNNATCPNAEYCDFDPGLCGKGKKAGSCRAIPQDCPTESAPVCACNGHIYNNACTAASAGIDLNTNGGCPALTDFIPCGENYCDAHTSYCEIYLSDVFDLPSGHYCRPLPASCLPTQNPKPTCDCFPKQTPCLTFCGPMPTGGLEGFHLTCQGIHDPN